VFGSVLASALAGCTLLVSADGLSGGDRPVDAGSSADVDAALDGHADATVGADAEPADDAQAPVLVCPQGALLCDDFERSSALGAFSNAKGEVTISSSHAHSPSRSLSAIVSQGQPAPTLETTVSGPRVRLSFWFLAPSAPSVAYIIRLAHLLSGPVCDWDFTWQLSLTQSGLTTDIGTYDSAVNPTCGPVDLASRALLTSAETFDSKWHHVVVDHDVSAQTRRSTIRVDDGPSLVDTLTSKRPGPVDSVLFGIGIPCVQNGGGCFDWDQAGDYGVFIDDITVTPLP